MKLTTGRIVHVRIGGDDDAPVLRPAIVVQPWSDSCANMQLFLDGRNDLHHVDAAQGTPAAFTATDCVQGLAWLTSVSAGDGVGCWRWPARV